MEITITKETADTGEEVARVALSGALTIERATELHSNLMQTSQEHSPIVLDLQAVEHCDVSGLQLIWAFMKELELKAIPVTIHQVSPSVLEAAYEAGIELEKILHLQEEA